MNLTRKVALVLRGKRKFVQKVWHAERALADGEGGDGKVSCDTSKYGILYYWIERV